MKEASGELSMTLIVIVAAGAILAIFLAFRKPIQNMISNMWGNFESKGRNALNNANYTYIQVPGYSIVLNK